MPIPPDYIQKAAQKALRDREQLPPSRRAGTRVGLARANQLAKGENLSLDVLTRMRSFIARHKGNYDAAIAKGLDNKTSKVIQAMNLWGGIRAFAWADREINKQRKN